MIYPCPMCGTPESSYGDSCCGKCEGKMAKKRMEDRKALRHQADNCNCAEGCRSCLGALAQIAEMDGDYGRAAMLMNQ